MLYQYYTVKEAGTHEKVIQKSRFIGYIARVNSENDAQEFIQKIKKQHHDATHNCSAYIIGDHDQVQKANDDGEPSGTAGIPMLEVLKKQTLKNVVVVVTRYFGGVKLGAGGLIRAYSSTTSETIKHVGTVKGELMQGYQAIIDYSLLGKVENTLRESSHIIHNKAFTEHVTLTIYTHIDAIESFENKMVEITNNQLTLKKVDQKYVETSV